MRSRSALLARLFTANTTVAIIGTGALGCVLPDTLTEEGSTPTNHQPVIISGRPTDFNAGKIAKSKSDLWSWGVTVRDGAAPGTVSVPENTALAARDTRDWRRVIM
jgi:hypothetical protein